MLTRKTGFYFNHDGQRYYAYRTPDGQHVIAKVRADDTPCRKVASADVRAAAEAEYQREYAI